MKYIFTPKFNFIDAAIIAANAILFSQGEWLLAICLATAGAFVSAAFEAYFSK